MQPCADPAPGAAPLAYAFQWLTIEGGAPAMGFTLDDVVIEWDETHPADQAPASSCANLPDRPGAAGRCVGGQTPDAPCSVAAGDDCPQGVCAGITAPCATVAVDRARLFDCDTSLLLRVQDPSAGTANQIDLVAVNVRSDSEPLGESFLLTETAPASGRFEGQIVTASTANLPGVIQIVPRVDANLIVSYADPDCDRDGPHRESGGGGEVGESSFADVDGDGTPNLGADGRLEDPAAGPFDDDNCFVPATYTDVANPGQEDDDKSCVDVNGDTSHTSCSVIADCSILRRCEDLLGRTWGQACVTNATCPVRFPICAIFLDPTACRGDRVGNACDNCPDGFNPEQEDTDADGVGDLCELDGNDADGDGILDPADNCPGLDNRDQADTGVVGQAADGVGDVCDGTGDREPEYGIVVSAGLNGLIDSVPAGDDMRPPFLGPLIWSGANSRADTFAAGDDLQVVPVGYIFDCNAGLAGPNGDGVLDGEDNCPGFCNRDQQDIDGDGIGDVCDTREDYDFDGVPNAVDNCPLEPNPATALGLQADVDADGRGDLCDPDSDDDNDDGAPDDLIQFFVPVACEQVLPATGGTLAIESYLVEDFVGGDGDNIADPAETVTLDLTIRNGVTDGSGKPIPVRGLVVQASVADPDQACLLQARADFGDLAPGEARTNPPDERIRMSIIDGPKTRSLSAFDQKKAEVRLTLSGEGVYQEQTLELPLSLDVLGDATGGGPLGGTGVLTETFDALAGTPGLAESFGRVGDTLSQVIAVVPAINCLTTPLGPPDCSHNAAANDWHLHHFPSEPANAPGGGRAHSGTGSLHMARHVSPTDPNQTSYRFRQSTAFVGPPVNLPIGGTPAVEWWHIVMMADDNAISFNSGEAGDLGSVQVSLDQDPIPSGDNFGPWQRLEPVLNPYDHGRDSLFTSSCKFDPWDDFFDASSGGISDETICPPQRGWSNQGEELGSDALNCTDSNGNGVPDCGSAETTGPGYTERGSVGTGVWVRTRIDLRPYEGQRLRVRWLFSSLAFGDPTFLSYVETPGAPGAFDIDEKDDGWYLDDITFTGLVETQLGLVVEGLTGTDDFVVGTNVVCGPDLIAGTIAHPNDVQVLPLGTPCAGDLDVVVAAGPDGVLEANNAEVCAATVDGRCTSAKVRIAGIPGCDAGDVGAACGSDADCGEEGHCLTEAVFATPYPGTPFTLDASATLFDRCEDGAELYEFSRCAMVESCEPSSSLQVMRRFEPDPRFTVYPTADSRYRVRVRCSSQPEATGCAGAAEVRVLVYQAAEAGTVVLGPGAVSCATEMAGDPEICDPLDPLRFAFAMPTQGAGASGLDLLRFAGGDLRSPELAAGACVAPPLGVGAAAGTPIVTREDPVVPPAPGEAAFYLLAHRVDAGSRPAGSGRIDGVRTPRLVMGGCP